MDLKDKIKVMQHFAEGGKVECSYLRLNAWEFADAPVWNWDSYDYRIHQSPIAAGNNPHNLTEDQVECNKGWRLLQEHEIKSDVSTRRNELPPYVLQMWLPEDEKWELEFRSGGNDRSCTYRTLLSPADLAKYDIQPTKTKQPPKTKQPLTAADFPPGTVIRCSGIVNWAMVLVTSPSYISVSFEYQISYERLMVGQWQYSTDQGKTWLPCYKEV